MAVLVPQDDGLSTAAVYAEHDRLGRGARGSTLSRCGASPRGAAELAAGMENDLEPAALSLRPELAATLADLRDAARSPPR